MTGSISVIGLGPGTLELLPPAAEKALQDADLIVGYTTYLEQIASAFPKTPRLGTGMRQEVARAKAAISQATTGKRVAVVSGGDAGIYGMAGLIFDLLGEESDMPVTIVPGISALNAAASLLGAPLMNDFAVISLSDYLTPIETILSRVKAAAKADFVLCLYNPKGKKRTEPFERTCSLLLDCLNPQQVVGIVTNAYRPNQKLSIIILDQLRQCDVGMNSIILIGNTQTRKVGDRMVTPRGYKLLDKENEK